MPKRKRTNIDLHSFSWRARTIKNTACCSSTKLTSPISYSYWFLMFNYIWCIRQYFFQTINFQVKIANMEVCIKWSWYDVIWSTPLLGCKSVDIKLYLSDIAPTVIWSTPLLGCKSVDIKLYLSDIAPTVWLCDFLQDVERNIP